MISVRQWAAQLQQAATQCRPMLEATLSAEMRRMAEEARALPGRGDPSWPPLAEATLEDKEKKGFGVPEPLFRIGELRGGIRGEAEGLRGVLGNVDKKAVYHEMGTSRMPPRPIYALILMRNLPRLEAEFNALAHRLLTAGGAR